MVGLTMYVQLMSDVKGMDGQSNTMVLGPSLLWSLMHVAHCEFPTD